MDREAKDAISLLQRLVRTPSFSTDEAKTADAIAVFLEDRAIPFQRIGHNIVSMNKSFDPAKKTMVLNSHHDTVKVVNGWTRDPFGGEIEGDRMYGLGSNDAGASLVSLISTFVRFYEYPSPFNLVLIASAEEENSGKGGVSMVLDQLQLIPNVGIIGEPTEMQMAIAEKGLMVVDGYAKGVAGHAARDEGINAIYEAIHDIDILKKLPFKKESDMLGKTRLTVSQIEGGHQHNVIPDQCHFVVDVRINECYKNEEVIEMMRTVCKSDLIPRSLKWTSSSIQSDHPLVKRGLQLGRKTFGSPTLSDQVHFKCPTLKMGPGRSERSHTADEYILLGEIENGIHIYGQMIENLIF